MKKSTLSFVASSLLIMSMTGCMGGKAPETATVTKDAPNQYQMELEGAPAWVLDPSVEGALCAIGSAKMGPAGLQFSVTEAAGNARDDLARQISVNVSNMLKNFTQQTGVGDQAAVDKVVANVSKQLAKQDLSGSKVTKKWISKTGTMWVLVVMPDPAKAKEAIKDAVKSSYKNDAALWQQFQAKKAQDELDAAMDKLDTKKAQ